PVTQPPSLHDALPIYSPGRAFFHWARALPRITCCRRLYAAAGKIMTWAYDNVILFLLLFRSAWIRNRRVAEFPESRLADLHRARSEEHTSELQSPDHL